MYKSKGYGQEPYKNHLKMEKYAGIKVVICQKTLEQGKVVCYTGLDGHRDRHT